MIDSNGHDVRELPFERATRLGVAHACYVCGLYNPSIDGPSCQSTLAQSGMKVYNAGGNQDPFAGYRLDHEPTPIVEASKECRPGLVPETIDRDAYDAFMRTLG